MISVLSLPVVLCPTVPHREMAQGLPWLGSAQAGELSWGWLEPSVEQGPGGILQSAGIPGIPLGFLQISAPSCRQHHIPVGTAGLEEDPSSCWIPQQNPSGSCWESLEQPRAGKGSAGFGVESAVAGAGCISCRINPFLSHSRCCRQGLEQLMVQRPWREWGEGKVRVWTGVGRVQALSAAQPHTGTFLTSQKAEMAGASLLPEPSLTLKS